jgi:hypothetical protein
MLAERLRWQHRDERKAAGCMNRTAPRWDKDNDRRTGTYLEMIQNQGWIR